MRRVLHWKRLLVVAVAVLVLGGSTVALNGYQVKRKAGTIRDRAVQAEEAAAGDPAKRDEAAELYEDYLRFRPKDEEAGGRYVRLLLDLAEARPDAGRWQKADEETVKFLNKFPNHPDERRRLVDLYLRGRRWTAARDQVKVLFDKGLADDPELLERAATVEAADGKPEKAGEYLKRAIDATRDPARAVKSYARMLDLLRAQNKHADALVYVVALGKPPFDALPEARVAAARYFLLHGDIEPAREEVAKARLLPGGADNLEVLLASAECEAVERKGNLDAARTYLERAFALYPKEVRVGLHLADVLPRQGKGAEAVAALRRTADLLGEVNDDFFVVVDRLLDLNDIPGASGLIDRIAKDPTLKMTNAYFRGRLRLLQGDWPGARADLELCLPNLEVAPVYHAKAAAALGRCYELSHNPDKMLEYHQMALKDAPNYYPALVGEAEALVKLGRVPEATRRYRALVPQSKALRPILVRYDLLEQLGRPPRNRNWDQFNDDLGPPPLTTEMLVLKYEALAVQPGKEEEARATLKAAEEQDPKSPLVAMAKLRGGGTVRPDEAMAAVAAAAAVVGDTVDLRLVKASILTARPGRKSVDDLVQLGVREDDKFPPADQYRLWYGLGEAAARLASAPGTDPAFKAAAVTLFQKAAVAEPLDLVVRAVLVDLGLAQDRPDVVDAALADIARIEGPNGPISNLGQVAVRLKSFKPGDAETLKDLRAKAEAARAVRPAWSRAHLAVAQIDELEGLPAAAVKSYLKALELGDRQDKVIRKTVDLLRDARQFQEAANLLDRLNTEMRLPDDLQRFRAIMSLVTSGTPRQEAADINKYAPVDSPDFRLQLLRGSLLAAIRRDDGAEAAFRAAVSKNDTSPDTWTALVGHLARVDKLADAGRAVAEAERKLRTTPMKLDVVLALAGMAEAVGDLKGADARFREAVALAPADVPANRQLVYFLQRTGRGADADAVLEALGRSPAQDLSRWARRHQALTLMGRPDPHTHLDKARRLVGQNLAAAPDDLEDRKALAAVRTVDPATRAEGMDALREYAGKGDLTPDELFLLGRLYFDQGQFEYARNFMEMAVVPGPSVSLDHLAGLVRLYLAMGRGGEARQTAERLRAVAPRSWEATREWARVQHFLKNDDEAKKLILAFPGADTPAVIASRSGPLLDEIGADAEAKTLYEKYMAESKTPGAHLPLAVFYITHKQPELAIELARKHEAGTPVATTASVLIGAARKKLPGPDGVAAIESWLSAKMAEYKDRPDIYPHLVGSLAELRDAQGRSAEAVAEYEKALRLAPNDVTTNNLCMLLSLQDPKRAPEAKERMDKMIAVRGPAPALLDTRALAYLVMGGKSEEAVKDLKLALAQQERAVYYFHLAWAYDQLRNRREFEAALAAARRLGIEPDQVHPKEMEQYRRYFGGN